MTDVLDGAPQVGELWPGDKGSLAEPSRRALVQLVKGPYLAAEGNTSGWDALLVDRGTIEARLADLFLELVVDREAEIAFVRGVRVDGFTAPQVVRTQRLTFMQTALLLHLRQILVRATPGERVIVGLSEVTDYLEVYRAGQGIDRLTLGKRVSGAWEKMHNYGLLHKTPTEGRSEISPALRLVFGPERIEQLTAEYERIASIGPSNQTSQDGPTGQDSQTGPDSGQGLEAGPGDQSAEGSQTSFEEGPQV
ncbi:MAG: DUF4194 domain-containing protein [Bifidobacteriaceae bacterium]|jgi:hypothetical protein|nr:DUF4194 domain-containing protein [Bifidobacteriaceae bacterium]